MYIIQLLFTVSTKVESVGGNSSFFPISIQILYVSYPLFVTIIVTENSGFGIVLVDILKCRSWIVFRGERALWFNAEFFTNNGPIIPINLRRWTNSNFMRILKCQFLVWRVSWSCHRSVIVGFAGIDWISYYIGIFSLFDGIRCRCNFGIFQLFFFMIWFLVLSRERHGPR